jgi:hypothetical protein
VVRGRIFNIFFDVAEYYGKSVSDIKAYTEAYFILMVYITGVPTG